MAPVDSPPMRAVRECNIHKNKHTRVSPPLDTADQNKITMPATRQRTIGRSLFIATSRKLYHVGDRGTDFNLPLASGLVRFLWILQQQRHRSQSGVQGTPFVTAKVGHPGGNGRIHGRLAIVNFLNGKVAVRSVL